MDKNFYDVFLLREADIQQVLDIQTECQLSEWTEKQYQEEFEREDSFVYGAKLEDILVGFIVARLTSIPTTTKPIVEGAEAEAELDILNLGVMKKHRKKGVGSLLLNGLLANTELTRRLKTVWLEVRESNVSAIKFYRKRGFQKIQIRNNFYRQPTENALVMRLDAEHFPVKF